jgi:hypothetical protein
MVMGDSEVLCSFTKAGICVLAASMVLSLCSYDVVHLVPVTNISMKQSKFFHAWRASKSIGFLQAAIPFIDSTSYMLPAKLASASWDPYQRLPADQSRNSNNSVIISCGTQALASYEEQALARGTKISCHVIYHVVRLPSHGGLL